MQSLWKADRLTSTLCENPSTSAFFYCPMTNWLNKKRRTVTPLPERG
jgi:hypothetical protein